MHRFKRGILISLALAFLGVSWLWEQLHPVVRWIIDRIPLESLKQAVVRFMDRLSPYPTLCVFLAPLVVVEPLKILAVWLLAKGQWALGVFTYLGTDILRLGLVSFLFKTCQDKLLSIPWFRRLYEWFVAAHEWAHAQVAPIRAALRRALAEAGLTGGRAGLWRKVAAVWRYARRRGARNA